MEQLRKDQDAVIRKINKIHAKLRETATEKAERLGDKLWNRLRGFYQDARKLADQEESECTKCLRELDVLGGQSSGVAHRKKPEWTEPKRKRLKGEDMTPNPNGPPSSSRLHSPSQTPRWAPDAISPGDQVAARVTSDDAPKDDWIVVKVTRYDRETNRFEVIDEEPGDDEENGQSKKYRLPPSLIIPFPRRSEAPSALDFPVGSPVLAVYPGTTALYKACVVGTPRKRKSDDYYLAFDDDEEEGVEGLPQRQVPFFHVVQLPQGHRQ